MKDDYTKIAKEFGIRFHLGRFGLKLLPRDPAGNIYKLFSMVPLDGWITDDKEVERIIRENGLEL